MRRSLSGICLFAVALGCALPLAPGCASDTAEHASRLGKLEMSLVATSTSGVAYRLRSGTFTITGTSEATVSSDDDLQAPSIDVPLQTGDYLVRLEAGWFLERAATDGTFSQVGAALISNNPVAFTIQDQQTTSVRFRFAVGNDLVEFGNGQLSIDIGVVEVPSSGGASGGTGGASGGTGGASGGTGGASGGISGVAGCGPYADGDVWDRTYNFQIWYVKPFAVGPNGRLHAGFYRGYAFSDDDGQTWTIKDLSAQISPQRPWPHPAVSADGNSVWLYVVGQGVLHSLDGGNGFAWVPALSSMSAFDRGWVTISPYHDQHILAYAVHEDAFGSLGGTLYRSTDSGATWVNLDSALATAGANGTLSATFDPATPDRFWIADLPEGVFETNNGGGSFASVPGSTHSFINTVARTSDGTNPRLVVTGSCSAPTSTVIGQNVWQASIGDSPHCCPAPIVVADPFEPTATVAYQCHDSGTDNLRYSTNGGVNLSLASWPTSLDSSSTHVESAHVDPYHRRTFYATHTNQWTILKSTDGGKTWASVGWLPGHGC